MPLTKRILNKVKSFVRLDNREDDRDEKNSMGRSSSANDLGISKTSLRDLHLQNGKSLGERLHDTRGRHSPNNLIPTRRYSLPSAGLFRKRHGSHTSLTSIPELAFHWNEPLSHDKSFNENEDEMCESDLVDDSGIILTKAVLEERLDDDIPFADEVAESEDCSGLMMSSGYGTLPKDTDKALGQRPNFNLQDLPVNEEPVEKCRIFRDKELHEQGALNKHKSNSVTGVEFKQLRHSESYTAIHVHSSRDVHINTAQRAYSDSEPTRSESLPQLWTSYDLSEGLNRIRVNTQAEFSTHKKEKRTTLTRAVEDCRIMAEMKDGKRTFIVIGNSKDGISCTGKNILLYLLKHWETLIVVSPREFRDADIHGNSRKVALLIDNMFGTNELGKVNVEKWSPYFDNMRSAVETKRVAIVLTMNKQIYEKYMFAENISPHDLFKEAMVIDLTNEYKYTTSEKIEMSKNLLETFPGATKVNFRKHYEYENIDTFKDGDELTISQETLESNVNASTQFGFPQQMKEYSSKKVNLLLKKELFYFPLDFHYIAINNLFESEEKKDKESVFAMVIIFVNNGELVTDKMSDYVETTTKWKQNNSTKKRQKQDKTLTKAKSSHLIDMMANRIEHNHLLSALTQGIENISGWLLQIDNGGRSVTFSSQLIYNTVGIVSSKHSQEDVIKNAQTEFVYKFCLPTKIFGQQKKAGQLEKCIMLSTHSETETLKTLMLRLANETIKGQRVAAVLGHPLMRQLWFVEKFLKYIKKEAKQSMFLLSLDKDSNMTILLHGLERSFDNRRDGDPLNFSELLVRTKFWQDNLKETSLKNRQELSALKYACEQGNYSSFECLYTQLRTTPDQECLKLAILANAVEIVEKLLKERFFKEEDLSKAFVYVCKTHCINNPELAKMLAIPIKKKIEKVDTRKKCLHRFIQEVFRSDKHELMDFLNDIECSIDITRGNPKFGSTTSMISMRSQRR